MLLRNSSYFPASVNRRKYFVQCLFTKGREVEYIRINLVSILGDVYGKIVMGKVVVCNGNELVGE